jgi:hypothetical protein
LVGISAVIVVWFDAEQLGFEPEDGESNQTGSPAQPTCILKKTGKLACRLINRFRTNSEF